MHLLLVGCGHLGQTMLRRWLECDENLRVTIIKPTPLNGFDDPRLTTHSSLPPDTGQPDVIIYAVRPQQLAAVLPAYRALAADALNISVAAGWSLAKFAVYLGNAALVRTMPNLPAQIGQAITPAIANAACSSTAKQQAEHLFNMIGKLVWLEDEAQMDAATALSGSGPAYVFLLASAMRAAGIQLGLSDTLATELTRTTVQGAANYLAQSQHDLATLYQTMLLPGGTTEAALTRLLASDGLPALMQEAMQLAAKRAGEIGQMTG